MKDENESALRAFGIIEICIGVTGLLEYFLNDSIYGLFIAAFITSVLFACTIFEK